jgi:hypothetical protein
VNRHRHLGSVVVIFAAAVFCAAGIPKSQSLPGSIPVGQALIWPSTPPPDCPFPRSAQITGLEFTGRHA